LVNRLPQIEFCASQFDAGGFNLHRHEPHGEPPPTLVVLVHGLGGSGYKTWGELPERLFRGDGAERWT
jgi:hypothetical protein